MLAPPPRQRRGAASNAELKKQVADTERAFAATMKARDHAAFTGFLSDEAVFFGGPGDAARQGGRGEGVAALLRQAGRAVFVGAGRGGGARFRHAGDQQRAGVRPGGKLISRFSSIWRQEAPGRWRIVFDKGNEVCDCKKP